MAKLAAHLLATACLWDGIQASLKIQNGQHKKKERLTHFSPPKKYLKKSFLKIFCNKMYFVQFQLLVPVNTELSLFI